MMQKIEIELEGEALQKAKQLKDYYSNNSPESWSFLDIVELAIENLYSEKMSQK